MSLSVKFNDIELNNILDVEIGFNPFDGAEWSRGLSEVPNSNGATLVSSKVNAKTISMPFRIKGDINTKYDSLQKALNVDEPKKLTFGNMPNRYFLAVTTGKTDFKEVKSGLIGHGTIEWVVPDGVSHSIDTKSVTASVVNGVLTANIDYQGSEETYPVFRIKHKDENGYIGIVKDNGVLELGNREIGDTKTRSKAVVVLNTTTFSELTRYTSANPENSRKNNDGTAKTVQINGDNNFILDKAGTNNGYWNGASYYFDIPADGTGHVGSKNVYSYFNAVMWAGAMGQTGEIQLLFTDSKNQLVMGCDIYKNDTSGNSAIFTALAGDGKGGVKTLMTRNFVTSDQDSQNPFNLPRGHGDIYKNGSTIRYYWWGGYPQFTVPELKDVEITRCYVNIYQLADRSGIKRMSYFNFRKLIIQNDKADYIYDIPNKYPKGSEIVIDTESDEIFVNGLPSNGDLVTGSEFMSLKPGKNKIEFYTSSWIKTLPDITVEWKERYL